jgi:organic radical activating enzyme
MPKKYHITEIFYSICGEGVLAGEPMVVVRFAGCNLECSRKSHGFDCDSEWESGYMMTGHEILKEVKATIKAIVGTGWAKFERSPRWVLFTGGEPGLQLDHKLINEFKPSRGLRWKIAVETNGSIDLSDIIGVVDHLVLSPKVGWKNLRQNFCDELRYVLPYGETPPKRLPNAKHYVVVPASEFIPEPGQKSKRRIGSEVNGRFLAPIQVVHWCIRFCLLNPRWRMSMQQQHEWWIR